MYPHERSLVNKLAGKPFALIGVNSDKDREAIKEIVKEKKITWRSFWNGPEGTSGPISTRWNVSGWPTIYVMDAEGVIRYNNVRGRKLDEAITELMAEIGHEVDLSNHQDPADVAEEDVAEEDVAEENQAADDEKAKEEKPGDDKSGESTDDDTKKSDDDQDDGDGN